MYQPFNLERGPTMNINLDAKSFFNEEFAANCTGYGISIDPPEHVARMTPEDQEEFLAYYRKYHPGEN